MTIEDNILNEIINKIDLIWRRKAVDYKKASEIDYIDPNENIKRMNTSNNNIVEGRRGSGKTTLLIKSIATDQNAISYIYDCQDIRNKENTYIIADIIKEILKKVNHFLEDNSFLQMEVDYKKMNTGIRGILKKVSGRTDKKLSEEYMKRVTLIEMCNTLSKEILYISESPDELKINTSQKADKKLSVLKSKKKNFQISSKMKTDIELLKSIKGFNATFSGSAALSGCWEKNYLEQFEETNSIEKTSEFVKIITKDELLDEYKKIFRNFIQTLNQVYNKKVILLLDDFYQIKKDNHPRILQYFHDIYKKTEDGSFCFKVVTLPYAIKLNEDNDVTFSKKDDYVKIAIDYSLSDLDKLRNYLLDILIGLDTNKSITRTDVESLFTGMDTLNYLVLSAGGLPRDFMKNFASCIEFARKLGNSKIGKPCVYEILKEAKADKEDNIEYDARDISKDIIEKYLKAISLFVDEKKTNVFLCHSDQYKNHEKIFNTLVNLRYLHLISDKVSSESTKRECVAFLIDMTFYATSRLPNGFKFCEFWVMDDASRLNNLRRSKIWDFDDIQ